METPQNRLDLSRLTEIALILILVALGIALYWLPAAYGVLEPRWWHAVVLGVLFFTVVGMIGHRRRVRGRRALREQMRRDAASDV